MPEEGVETAIYREFPEEKLPACSPTPRVTTSESDAQRAREHASIAKLAAKARIVAALASGDRDRHTDSVLGW